MNRFCVLLTALALIGAAPAVKPAATPSPAPVVPILNPAPKATATPAPPQDTYDKRIGISGVWELQLQRATGTIYTHFKIDQKDNVLSGQYLDAAGKKYPLTGLLDGKTVRVVVAIGSGVTLVFTATHESFTDMIGVLDDSKDTIPFTAAYRPKYKWLDNVNAGPGGYPGVP